MGSDAVSAASDCELWRELGSGREGGVTVENAPSPRRDDGGGTAEGGKNRFCEDERDGCGGSVGGGGNAGIDRDGGGSSDPGLEGGCGRLGAAGPGRSLGRPVAPPLRPRSVTVPEETSVAQ